MTALARRSFIHFFYIFFRSYVEYPIAPFHKDMFRCAQNDSLKRIVLVAFRGSAKSTIYSTALPLWVVTGSPKKKHIVIATSTQQRASDHSANIAREIEGNDLLRKYLGPFEEEQGRWSVPVRVLPRYNARISFVSVEEGIRGIREGPHRPDYIIADDIEDYGSVKTREGRDKTFEWLTGELIPIGDIDTKVVLLGNFLHEDSSLMRIIKAMREGTMDGVFMKVPIMDEDGKIAWPGKFPSLELIERFRRGIGNEITWQLEYMLKAVPKEDQIVFPEWIQYYDSLPEIPPKDEQTYTNMYRGVFTAADLAISTKETAHYTAIVSAKIFKYRKDVKIYILPHPVNKRMTFPETLEKIKTISRSLGDGMPTPIYIEDVAYQKSIIQQLRQENFPAEGISPQGQDKTARLRLITPLLEKGQVLFPRRGAEQLIQQLLGFGSEKYDDLVDAFTMLILKLREYINESEAQIRSL